MSDMDWDKFKKETSATVHNDLGVVATVRRNWDAADHRIAGRLSPTATEPTFEARLAATYLQAGKNAEAIALCDKLLAEPMGSMPPNAVAQIKNYATKLKASAVKASAPAPAPQK